MVPPSSTSGKNQSYRPLHPPHSPENLITWGNLGKFGVGALLAWAAWEFRGMREAVYSSQTKIAVVEKTVERHEKEIERTNRRVETLEARIMSGGK